MFFWCNFSLVGWIEIIKSSFSPAFIRCIYVNQCFPICVSAIFNFQMDLMFLVLNLIKLNMNSMCVKSRISYIAVIASYIRFKYGTHPAKVVLQYPVGKWDATSWRFSLFPYQQPNSLLRSNFSAYPFFSWAHPLKQSYSHKKTASNHNAYEHMLSTGQFSIFIIPHYCLPPRTRFYQTDHV